MTKIFYFLLLATLIGIYLNWTAKHDEQIMMAADKYETCVMNEYNTTPSAWYQEHGEYPYCEN